MIIIIIKIISDSIYKSYSFTFAISPFSKQSDFINIETIVLDLRKNENIDYILLKYFIVFSIHCKQIFPDKLINSVKCINVHPGYNPINRGWYPQVFSIYYDLPIGATIHEIDSQLDHGKIIVRSFVEKKFYDTSLSLYNRIVEKELDLLRTHMLNILENNYHSYDPEDEGFLYTKNDFNKLCKIDLNEIGTCKQFIDKLRSLSHGDFKNCFYIDIDTGKKIFIKIMLDIEN
jgi:methionyl-tRNA formyltransferase